MILSQYLQDLSNNSSLSISLLQFFIKGSWQVHRGWWNANKISDPFQFGDIFKSHVQIHSSAKKGVVQKLYYWVTGTFQTIIYCGYNYYDVQWYDDANGVVQKYKDTKIYVPHPLIYPHEPLDKTYECYTNY